MCEENKQFVKTGEIIIPGEEPPSFVFISASDVTGQGAASTSDANVHVFDSSTAQIVATYKAHDAAISGLDYNKESQIIATCAYSGKGNSGNEVTLCDIRCGQLIGTLSAAAYVKYINDCLSVSQSCDGCVIGVGTNAGVLCWDVRNPESAFKHVNIQAESIASLQFHPFTNTAFLSGDDDGNLLLFDLDSTNDEEGTIFCANDGNPVFQCGFCNTEDVFTLRRNAGIRILNIEDMNDEIEYEDLRPMVNNVFNYPIDAHFCGEYIMVVGGDSDGGVAITLCSRDGVTLFNKLQNAHKDTINASYLSTNVDGTMVLYLAGDSGQLSFWTIPQEE